MTTYIDMACHTWALAANTTTGAAINNRYQRLCDDFARKYVFGSGLRGKKLHAVRLEAMQLISELCEKREFQLSNDVYLCGGFRNGQVCPEHLWLEDHTAGITYDTFINEKIRLAGKVGRPNQPFEPGCELRPFGANEIARISVKGFTRGQTESVSLYGEQV